MEAASNFFSSNFMSSGVLSGKSLMDFTPLNKSQKRHMRRVYSMLTLGILSTALGALFDIYVFRIPHFIAIIATIGFIFATVSSSTTTDSLKRSGYFLAFAFFKGILIASLLEIAHRVHPAIISTAFFISLAIFAAFALTAMFATERSFLFLGGVLSSVVFYMGMAGLANIFFQSQIIFDIQLYGGLVVFLGKVVQGGMELCGCALPGRTSADRKCHGIWIANRVVSRPPAATLFRVPLSRRLAPPLGQSPTIQLVDLLISSACPAGSVVGIVALIVSLMQIRPF
eukprot:GHVU01146927.1.p1 GENE.GHVU01146927.1~~GHVU01146927.1.p1  ORF type:complete len:285 (-),score=16.61 GHVU01146927.1:1480-2334(-)